MEYYWIRMVLLGEQDHAPITTDEPDAEMRLALDIPSRGCWLSTGPTVRSCGGWWARWTSVLRPRSR